MSNPSYKILITAIEAYGHINAICGFGELLARNGHNVIFTQRLKYKNLADQHGFAFIPFDEALIGSSFEDSFFDWMDANMDKIRRDPMERYKNYTEEEKEAASLSVITFRKLNEALTPILASNSFDAIVADGMDILDCLYKSKIPVISSFSASPLILYSNGPPGMSGLSPKGDPETWRLYTKYFDEANVKMTANFNSMLKESGRAEIFESSKWILPQKHFGFYHYPSDLDFTECGPCEPKWHRIDCYVRSPDKGPFEIPDILKDKPGKLIYFSLGSTASNDLLIMNKCLSALARCGHRVIVSMGRRGDKLSLADNMWGQEYVNQVAIIQVVDLVITHGGNNTFMESLYHGKPMIVVPWFFDQLDNAQRVVDKDIGCRVNPWEFDENYFLECIDKILNNTELQERVKKISENMRKSDSGTKAVKMIEQLIRSEQMKFK